LILKFSVLAKYLFLLVSVINSFYNSVLNPSPKFEVQSTILAEMTKSPLPNMKSGSAELDLSLNWRIYSIFAGYLCLFVIWNNTEFIGSFLSK